MSNGGMLALPTLQGARLRSDVCVLHCAFSRWDARLPNDKDCIRFLMLKEVEQTEETSARTQDHLIIVQNWFEELKRLVSTN